MDKNEMTGLVDEVTTVLESVPESAWTTETPEVGVTLYRAAFGSWLFTIVKHGEQFDGVAMRGGTIMRLSTERMRASLAKIVGAKIMGCASGT